jgi:ABC-type lipoprotein export system ATPase subunit
MTDNIINIKNLSKEYIVNKNKVCILKNINFNLVKGDIISISGPSGSGKSTLLNILGLLDSNFQGVYEFLNYNVLNLNISQKNIIRNKSIGFVHQFFYLIPELNVLENISLPNLIYKQEYKETIKSAKKIIDNFGLTKRMYSKPSNLSGGEQQRVAIARALINKPDIIIADEMTGNLDEKTAISIFDFFLETIKLNQQSLIYVTHNKNFAERANNLYKITNQKLIKLK